MEIIDKLSEGVYSASMAVSEKAKDVADTTKLQYEKSKRISAVKKAYYKIGKMYFESKPEVIAPEFIELFNAVEEDRTRIKELNDIIIGKKGGVTCDKCGCVCVSGAAYCSGCGSKLDEIIED